MSDPATPLFAVQARAALDAAQALKLTMEAMNGRNHPEKFTNQYQEAARAVAQLVQAAAESATCYKPKP